MYSFSDRSRRNLDQCDPRLVILCEDVIKVFDFTVTCGHRGREAQEDAVAAGASWVHWPHGRHNRTPSLAVDLAPYPIDWNNLARFEELGRLMKLAALIRGIDLTWGGDWRPERRDIPHFQVDPPVD